MKSTTSQRGQILLYAMLTMSVMLAAGLSLNSLFISKLRSAAAARDATVALFAADSASEMCLYEARTGTNASPLTMINGATYVVVDVSKGTDITADCSTLGSAYTFRATGAYRGTSRALEISQ